MTAESGDDVRPQDEIMVIVWAVVYVVGLVVLAAMGGHHG